MPISEDNARERDIAMRPARSSGGPYSLTPQWKIADGWATRAEAEDHARRLRAEHSDYAIRVRHGQAYGGGKWLVEYRKKGAPE